MRHHTRLLHTRRFLPLFITQFFGAFNDNAFKNAFLIWFTYDVAVQDGLDAPMMVTLAAGLFILPFFLFSSTAGQVADAYERAWLTRKIKQVEIVLMVACAVCFVLESVYGLLVVLFLMGVQSTFFGPIKYSLLPVHLRDEELIAGNGMVEAGTFMSILLGTIFGGLVIRMEHGVALLSFGLVTFACVGWLASRSIPKAEVGDADLKMRWNMAATTWEILKYARHTPAMWFCVLGISWFWLVGATFLTQMPTYTKEVVGGNAQVVTLFLTLFSIGIGLGSVWCHRLLKGEIHARLVPWGCLGMSFFIVDFYLASMAYPLASDAHPVGVGAFFEGSIHGWRIVLDLLGLSICAGIYIVPLYTLLQHRGRGAHLARMIAANNVMNALLMVLGSFGALALFALGWQVTEILLAVGVLNLLVFFKIRGVVRSGAL